MEQKNKSVGALVEFIDSLPLMGAVGESTLKNLKAVPKMLQFVDSSINNFEDIDAEATVEAFIEETNAQVGAPSRSSYKSRINQAIKLYRNYLNDPMSIVENQEKEVTTKNPRPEINLPQFAIQPAATKIDIPVPIRDGLILMIPGVPTDLTNEEAERIASILKVYARPQ